MKNDEEVVRAYSMASYPAEGRNIMLNVRVAAPPWDRAKDSWADVNPGVASSYIFNQISLLSINFFILLDIICARFSYIPNNMNQII